MMVTVLERCGRGRGLALITPGLRPQARGWSSATLAARTASIIDQHEAFSPQGCLHPAKYIYNLGLKIVRFLHPLTKS